MSAEDIEEFIAFVKDERLALFPWLNLEGEVPFGGYVFAPVFVGERLHASLESDDDRLSRILTCFCDEQGRPITGGTFVLASTGEWALAAPKHQEVKRLQGLLLLACYGENGYYSVDCSYVNTAAFALYCCKPSLQMSFDVRRRDGPLRKAGVGDGSFRFYMPSQCAHLKPAKCDVGMLRAFEEALSKRAAVLEKIDSALPFFDAANRDENASSLTNEGAMLVAAYEQLARERDGLGDGADARKAVEAVPGAWKRGERACARTKGVA